MFTFEQVAQYYRASAARCEAEMATVVLTVVERGAVLARSFIGQEQEGWAPLSSATVDGFRHHLGFWVMGKADLGYGGAESPLMREGDLQRSISAEADGLVGIVGSDSKIGLYQELGTPNADYPIPSSPPRSFLAKGLMEAETGVEELVGLAAVSLLLPR